MITNADPTAWFRDHIAMESEGEVSPAQSNVEIRADFPRHLFCLYVNGEAVGASSHYKAVWLTRQFLLGELV